MNFRRAGNRRYVSDKFCANCSYHGWETSVYPLPNDEEEVERLEILQILCRDLFGGNILAPISQNPTQIG